MTPAQRTAKWRGKKKDSNPVEFSKQNLGRVRDFRTRNENLLSAAAAASLESARMLLESEARQREDNCKAGAEARKLASTHLPIFNNQAIAKAVSKNHAEDEEAGVEPGEIQSVVDASTYAESAAFVDASTTYTESDAVGDDLEAVGELRGNNAHWGPHQGIPLLIPLTSEHRIILFDMKNHMDVVSMAARILQEVIRGNLPVTNFRFLGEFFAQVKPDLHPDAAADLDYLCKWRNKLQHNNNRVYV